MGGGSSALTSLATSDLPEIDPAICTHKFCEKWGPGHFHCADCHSTITNETLMAEEDRIIDGIVDDSVPEDGVNRGVSIQFLVDFATACNCWHMTTRDVRRRFVMPATRATRCRFVELSEMASVVGRATTFVSHTWGAKFGDLVAALCDGNADRSRIVWVDIFAVRQWPSHKPDLDFSAVVRQCQSFVIVCSLLPEVVELSDYEVHSRNTSLIPTNVRSQVAFLRVWCLVEVHAALQADVAIIMKGGSYSRSGENEIAFETNARMLQRLCFFVDIESAEATVASDKQRILNEINSTEGGVAAVNDAIRGLLAGAELAAPHPMVQCAACGDASALQELLRAPSQYVVPVAACGHVHLLHLLIENGADISTVAPVEAAALGGHLKCLQMLISHGCDVTVRGSNNGTCLMFAAVGGHTQCVQILISRGCDVCAQDVNGLTALMFAVFGGSVPCIELLMRSGCDVSAVDVHGNTALVYAQQLGDSVCAAALQSLNNTI